MSSKSNGQPLKKNNPLNSSLATATFESANKETLTNLSPLDGRYHRQVQSLKPIFSEFGLIYHRVIVEVRWFQALAAHPNITELPALEESSQQHLEHLINHFDEQQVRLVKDFEKETNHDVKAVEYFLKKCCADDAQLSKAEEFWHFACTSEDINNVAYALMLRSWQKHLVSQLDDWLVSLNEFSKPLAGVPMLSRTHGQPASPTTLGKEMSLFYFRLQRQLQQLKSQPILAKMNGAVGNFNAHQMAYPEIDWREFSRQFIHSLDLTYNPMTSQIESHDYCAELAHVCMRINQILLDFSRDIWLYISQNMLTQKIQTGEVSSSTMPHKVNPIDFENAEGNLGVSNALLAHLGNKLLVSRLQRDLSDSTVQRNWGTACGHMQLAIHSLQKGLQKLQVNTQQLSAELEQNPQVITEAIQTVMRRYGIKGAYEQLKELSRGKQLSLADYQQFIETLPVPPSAKQRLLELTPSSYIGLAAELTNEHLH